MPPDSFFEQIYLSKGRYTLVYEGWRGPRLIVTSPDSTDKKLKPGSASASFASGPTKEQATDKAVNSIADVITKQLGMILTTADNADRSTVGENRILKTAVIDISGLVLAAPTELKM